MTVNYAQAPIMEAILELRFGGSAAPDALEVAKVKLAKRYPKVEDIRQFSVAIDAAGGSGTSELIGHKLTSEDGTGIVQIRPDIIGISQLAPYQGWEAFEERARAAMRLASTLIKQRPVTRAAVRYINRIDVPSDGPYVRQSDYLAIKLIDAPFKHDEDAMTEFRLVTTVDQGAFGVIVNAGQTESPLINHSAILLDIDLYNQVSLPKFKDIWAHLRQMRNWKNTIFEACITARTRELIS